MLIDRAMRLLAATTFLLGIGFGGLVAETPDGPEAPTAVAPNGYQVTVFNAHRYGVQVYLEGPRGEEDRLLGTVDADQVETFQAPEGDMLEENRFMLSVRPMGPQPGLGQSRTTANKMLVTEPLPNEFDGVIKLIVTPDINNSSVSLVEPVA